MISTIQSHASALYVAQGGAKETNAKEGVEKTQKSEALDKVSTIKEQIQNGSYRLDMAQTARSIVDEMF